MWNTESSGVPTITCVMLIDFNIANSANCWKMSQWLFGQDVKDVGKRRERVLHFFNAKVAPIGSNDVVTDLPVCPSTILRDRQTAKSATTSFILTEIS